MREPTYSNMSQAEELSGFALLSQRVRDGIRYMIGTALVQPDGYLYPFDVREKAGDILGLVSTLGHISTTTVAQRADIVSSYEPRQVTGLVRASEQMHWTTKPGFYSALARRVVRDSSEVNFLPHSPGQRPRSVSKVPQPAKRHSRTNKPRLTLIKNDD